MITDIRIKWVYIGYCGLLNGRYNYWNFKCRTDAFNGLIKMIIKEIK